MANGTARQRVDGEGPCSSPHEAVRHWCPARLSVTFQMLLHSLTHRLLADLIFWVSVVCCAVAEIAIVRSTLRVSADRSMSASGILRPRRVTEIAWTVLPAVALAAVLVFTWYAIHPHVSAAPPAALMEHRS